MEHDTSFFARRMADEIAAAAAAEHPIARERHQQMADAYQLKLAELRAKEQRLMMHLVNAA